MSLPKYPLHLDVEMSTCCQLKCIQCPHSQMKRPKTLMNFDLIEKIVDEIRGKGVRTMYAHRIGESLLHPRLFEAVELFEKVGVRTSTSTNGLLLRKRKDEILSSRLSELTLCLDGMEKFTYEKYRVGARFEEVLYNIFDFLSDWSLKKSKIHLQLQLIVMGQSNKEIEQFRKTFSKFTTRGSFEILVKPYSTFAGRVKDLPGNTPKRRQHCDKVFRELSIGVDSNTSICCRDFSDFLVLGNIKEQSIQEIWNGKEYARLRDLFKKGKQQEVSLCKNC